MTEEEKESEQIMFVVRQTNYNYETAKAKLLQHNGNHIQVIKEYMGILPQTQKSQVASINQEIYKQIRKELDYSMRTYNDRNPIDTNDVISKFQQYENK